MKLTICDRCGEVFTDKGTQDTIKNRGVEEWIMKKMIKN